MKKKTVEGQWEQYGCTVQFQQFGVARAPEEKTAYYQRRRDNGRMLDFLCRGEKRVLDCDYKKQWNGKAARDPWLISVARRFHSEGRHDLTLTTIEAQCGYRYAEKYGPAPWRVEITQPENKLLPLCSVEIHPLLPEEEKLISAAISKATSSRKAGPGRKPFYDPKDLKRAAEMRNQGQPVKEIAHEMNRKPREIEKMLDAGRQRKKRLERNQ